MLCLIETHILKTKLGVGGRHHPGRNARQKRLCSWTSQEQVELYCPPVVTNEQIKKQQLMVLYFFTFRCRTWTISPMHFGSQNTRRHKDTRKEHYIEANAHLWFYLTLILFPVELWKIKNRRPLTHTDKPEMAVRNKNQHPLGEAPYINKSTFQWVFKC